jgi:DNA-binding SARP family transcriptional activator
MRLAATEEWLEIRLAGGQHAELVGALTDLVGRHPLRERLHRQLMVALDRSGRQAEALAAYQRARHTLNEQLGLDPSPPLRALEQAMLRQDPSLAAPQALVLRRNSRRSTSRARSSRPRSSRPRSSRRRRGPRCRRG